MPHVVTKMPKKSTWRRHVMVNTMAQLHLTKFELKFCAGGSNPAQGIWKASCSENRRKWSGLEIRPSLNYFRKQSLLSQ